MLPRTLTFLLVAVMLLLPSRAAAGTVRVTLLQDFDPHNAGLVVQQLAFEAAPGERNDVVVTHGGNGVGDWVISDRGAPLTPAAGCRAVSGTTAICRLSEAPDATRVVLGDADDRAAIRAPDVTVDGGAGADVLAGEGRLNGGGGADTISGSGTLAGDTGDDILQGGPSVDQLDGGPGRDVVRGGDGDDDVRDADTAPDALDGGAGRDSVAMTGEAVPLRVDLRIADGPQVQGSHNLVTAMEHAQTGPGDDVLWAAGDGSELAGGDGADVLHGGAGNDRADGGRGPDVFDLGSGRDHVVAAGDYARDEVHCGVGADDVDADEGDRVGAGCERVRRVAVNRAVLDVDAPVQRDGRRIRVGYDCRDADVDDCAGDVAISVIGPRGRRPLGRVAVGCASVPPCRSARSDWLRLPSAVARRWRRDGRLTLRITTRLFREGPAGTLPIVQVVRIRW